MLSAVSRESAKNITRALLLLITISTIACSDIDKIGISQMMDARDQAISSSNIAEYSALISADYHHLGSDKVATVARIIALFDKFEQVEMSSHDRQIRRLSDTQAQCEQSYTLKVFADGRWRQIVQREQLTLTKESRGWKISSGL